MADGSVYFIFHPHGEVRFYGKTDVFGLALVLLAGTEVDELGCQDKGSLLLIIKPDVFVLDSLASSLMLQLL